MTTDPDEMQRQRYAKLPERVRPEEMVETTPVSDARDPDGGQTERDVAIRYVGG